MSSLVISGDTSGSVTLQAPAVSGTTVLTLPATSGTVLTTASGTAATATNLAGGVAGAIPYQSGSGTTGFSAAGTSGQVLQSNGVSAPTWVTPSAGALTLLSTVTAATSATMDIENTFSSTYDKYLISVTGLFGDTDGQQLRMRLKLGGTYVAGTSYIFYIMTSTSAGGAVTGTNESDAGGGNAVIIQNNLGNTSGASTSFNLYIQNPTSTTLKKLFYFDGAGLDSTAEVQLIRGSGANKNTTALTGVRFFMGGGNIQSGVARLYGIANS